MISSLIKNLSANKYNNQKILKKNYSSKDVTNISNSSINQKMNMSNSLYKLNNNSLINNSVVLKNIKNNRNQESSYLKESFSEKNFMNINSNTQNIEKIRQNSNSNIGSNNFNPLLSNSNFNNSQTLTKYSDTKINPSYEKCKYF